MLSVENFHCAPINCIFITPVGNAAPAAENWSSSVPTTGESFKHLGTGRATKYGWPRQIKIKRKSNFTASLCCAPALTFKRSWGSLRLCHGITGNWEELFKCEVSQTDGRDRAWGTFRLLQHMLHKSQQFHWTFSTSHLKLGWCMLMNLETLRKAPNTLKRSGKIQAECPPQLHSLCSACWSHHEKDRIFLNRWENCRVDGSLLSEGSNPTPHSEWGVSHWVLAYSTRLGATTQHHNILTGAACRKNFDQCIKKEVVSFRISLDILCSPSLFSALKQIVGLYVRVFSRPFHDWSSDRILNKEGVFWQEESLNFCFCFDSSIGNMHVYWYGKSVRVVHAHRHFWPTWSPCSLRRVKLPIQNSCVLCMVFEEYSHTFTHTHTHTRARAGWAHDILTRCLVSLALFLLTDRLHVCCR